MLCTLHGGMCALHLGESARLEEAFLYSSTRACAEPECDTEARFCRVTGEDALRVWGEEGAHAAMDYITAHPEGVEERACQKHFAERAKDGQFWLRRLVQNRRCGNKWCDGSRREGGALCGGESCLCSTCGEGATMCGVRPEHLRMFVSLLPPPPPPPPPPPAPSTPPPCRKRRRAEIEAHPAFDKPSMWNVTQLVDFILDRPGTPDRLPEQVHMHRGNVFFDRDGHETHGQGRQGMRPLLASPERRAGGVSRPGGPPMRSVLPTLALRLSVHGRGGGVRHAHIHGHGRGPARGLQGVCGGGGGRVARVAAAVRTVPQEGMRRALRPDGEVDLSKVSCAAAEQVQATFAQEGRVRRGAFSVRRVWGRTYWPRKKSTLAIRG